MWANRSRLLFCKERCEQIVFGLSLKLVILSKRLKSEWVKERIPNPGLVQTMKGIVHFLTKSHSVAWPMTIPLPILTMADFCLFLGWRGRRLTLPSARRPSRPSAKMLCPGIHEVTKAHENCVWLIEIYFRMVKHEKKFLLQARAPLCRLPLPRQGGGGGSKEVA